MVSSRSLLKVPWCEERGVPGREDERKQLMKPLGFVSISPSGAGRKAARPRLTLAPPAPPGRGAFLENSATCSEYVDYSHNYKLRCKLKETTNTSFYSPLCLSPRGFRLPRFSSERVCRVTLEGTLSYHQPREGFRDPKIITASLSLVV